LKGYRLALEAEWVFQIDSDHQLDTAAFANLWANRENKDLLIAERMEKNATAGRNRLSSLSRFMVQLLYGCQVKDVNSPYRLMRAAQLRPALERIPSGSFAPNILITSWFVAKKGRIFTSIVEVRKEGSLRQSKLSGYIFRGALRSAFQTILFRIRL
jgi:dolichol-phosphate mannosyltransferase